jgi:c-di-GMP-binding flagellar brake protein YcgR
VSSERKSNVIERRAASRFSIELNVRYKVMGNGGAREMSQGKTVNISSRGILITTDQALTPGKQVEVEVEWPVKRNARIPLMLFIRGRIVRSKKGQVALAGLEIVHHEFCVASGRSA